MSYRKEKSAPPEPKKAQAVSQWEAEDQALKHLHDALPYLRNAYAAMANHPQAEQDWPDNWLYKKVGSAYFETQEALSSLQERVEKDPRPVTKPRIPNKEEWMEEAVEMWVISDRMMHYAQDMGYSDDDFFNPYSVAQEWAEEEWEEKYGKERTP